jgi:hypothetical protein
MQHHAGQGRGTKSRAAAALVACLLALLVIATSAQAKEVRLPQTPIGSFAEPRGLAVDQKSHDVYAIGGRNEQQTVTVSATAGKFKLKYEGKTSKELAFNAGTSEVRDALREVVCGGVACVFLNGGPGNATGSNPYAAQFAASLATTDVAQVECLSGTPPLSGGSGCSVTTTTNGVNGNVSRYHANGTPAEFTALGSNVIDGLEGPDLTPQKGLHFSPNPLETQVAIDESSGETAGDIYVTQPENDKVDVFGAGGEHLGELTEYEETPGNEATLKPLGRVSGVAVDAAGDIYVADLENGIHKYDPSGAVAANTDNVANFTSVEQPCALAAGRGATAGSLFAVAFSGGNLFKLDATTGAVKYEVSKGDTAIAVDPASGHVLAAAKSEIAEWDASGAGPATAAGSFSAAGHTTGVAVDGAGGKGGTVYLTREGSTQIEPYGPYLLVPDVSTGAASGIGATTATLHGTISADNGPNATCSFQYTTEAAYLADKAISGHDGFTGAQSAPCEGGPFAGSATNAVSAQVSGLAKETLYRFRIVGENEHTSKPADDPGEASSPFETLGKPAIEGGEASEVTTTEATISGEVNPRSFETTFSVQYVTESKFLESGFAEATATAPQDIGDAIASVEVSQLLTGLAPDTSYRFRLTAQSEAGIATPGPVGSFATFPAPTGLLDDRAYELVSPPARSGGEVWPAEPYKHGGASCKSCVPGWNNEKAPMQASPDGNAVAYEGDPFFPGLAAEYDSYVSRRGAGAWQTTGLSTPQLNAQAFRAFSPGLSVAVLEQTQPALSADAPEGYADLYLREEGKGLSALNTTTPPNREAGGDARFKLTYAGANAGTEAAPAFSHVVFQANDALTPAEAGIAPKAPSLTASETDLYEWSGGRLHLVNVLPGNATAAPNATIGSGQLLEVGQNETYDFDHAISADGSRVFWSEQPSGQVYVREGGATTTKVPDPGKFITATPSGSKVLLSDGKLYDLEAKSLTDLTAGKGGFQGMAGASEDLSRVYFVDTKVLAEGENEYGAAAEEGAFNLYLWEAGSVGFIATLATKDNRQGDTGQLGVWRASPGARLAQASADGRFLAFQAGGARLTGYDNTVREAESCIGSGKGTGGPVCPEVFEYDAATGSLRCPSCNPTGVRPLGGSTLTLINSTDEPFPQPGNLPPEGEGRLFFESLDQLTPADRNGRVADVYEWEPQGVGSCAQQKGCLSLISSGQGAKDSQFINASATGNDVFFTTRDRLVPEDDNEFTDLYDARAGGGFNPLQSPPCEGEACRGASSVAPGEPSAASALFAGPPNQAEGHRAKHKRKHHGKRKRHRKAKHKRGGTR